MTRYVNTHALERAVTKLDRSGKSLEQTRAAEGYDALQEIETQFQVPIWGTALGGIYWASFDLHFDVQFVFAPNQRDSPLTVPHFTYGAVVAGVTPEDQNADPANLDAHVFVDCHVTEWISDPATESIIGARMVVGVSTFGGATIKFDGYVHVTFQGYGAVVEATGNLDVGG